MLCRLSLVLRLFCFGFVSMLSLKPRPFVQSFFDMQAPRHPHVFRLFFLLFLWRCRFFRDFFNHYRFLFDGENVVVFSFRMVFFYLVTAGWILFFCIISSLINCIKCVLFFPLPSDQIGGGFLVCYFFPLFLFFCLCFWM